MSVTAIITIRIFSSAIVITYLSRTRLHRSRLFEPDSCAVFACHSSDEPSRRNVTAGCAYTGGPSWRVRRQPETLLRANCRGGSVRLGGVCSGVGYSLALIFAAS